MVVDIKKYKDLTGLLLGVIRQRLAMYLGQANISLLPNFIQGYSMGFHMAKEDGAIDEYFGDAGFLEWFHKKYDVPQSSFWQDPFMAEANHNEKKALDLFFNYLAEYSAEKSKK